MELAGVYSSPVEPAAGRGQTKGAPNTRPGVTVYLADWRSLALCQLVPLGSRKPSGAPSTPITCVLPVLPWLKRFATT
jgi:hypothetical protein